MLQALNGFRMRDEVMEVTQDGTLSLPEEAEEGADADAEDQVTMEEYLAMAGPDPLPGAHLAGCVVRGIPVSPPSRATAGSQDRALEATCGA